MHGAAGCGFPVWELTGRQKVITSSSLTRGVRSLENHGNTKGGSPRLSPGGLSALVNIQVGTGSPGVCRPASRPILISLATSWNPHLCQALRSMKGSLPSCRPGPSARRRPPARAPSIRPGRRGGRPNRGKPAPNDWRLRPGWGRRGFPLAAARRRFTFRFTTMQPNAQPSVPRSAHDRTGGIVYFDRMLDKIRLHGAGALRSDYRMKDHVETP